MSSVEKMIDAWLEDVDDMRYWLSEEEFQHVMKKGTYMLKFIASYELRNLNNKAKSSPSSREDPPPTVVVDVEDDDHHHQEPINYKSTDHHIRSLVIKIKIPKKKENPTKRKAPVETKKESSSSKKARKDSSHPFLAEGYMEKIKEMKGDINGVKLVAEKELKKSDVNPQLNRLMIPFKRLFDGGDFLTAEEKTSLDKQVKLPVTLIEPCNVVGGSDDDDVVGVYTVIRMNKWEMGKCKVLAWVDPWRKVVERNNFNTGDVIQLWSFRIKDADDTTCDGQLGLAIVKI